MYSDPAVKKEFYRKLTRFHRDRGTDMTKLPILGKQEMDLCWLYEQVTERGGIRSMVLDRRWPEIVKQMTLPRTCTNAGYSLKLIYQRYLLDYERVHLWNLPDIPPANGARGGMPVPDYLPENVNLLDPFNGEARPSARHAALDDDGPSGRTRPKRTRSEASLGDAMDDPMSPPPPPPRGGPAAPLGALTMAAEAAAAEDVEDDGEEGAAAFLQRDLNETARRVAMSLACVDDAAEVDWALGVLLVQSHMKLPIFARDPGRRMTDALAAVLQQCVPASPKEVETWQEALAGEFLVGAGRQRRKRIATVLGNAARVEENARAMAGSSALLAALVHDLAGRAPTYEDPLETRLQLFVVLDTMLSKGARLAEQQTAVRLVNVLGGELLSRDLRRPACLSSLARLTRDRDHLQMIAPGLTAALLADVVRMLGDALLCLSSAHLGGEDGLLELESSLEICYQCAEFEALAPLIAAQPMLTHHLVMLLLAAMDQTAPRVYVAFFRKALSVLTTLSANHAAIRRQLVTSHLSDLLLLVSSKSAISADVPPLLSQLRLPGEEGYDFNDDAEVVGGGGRKREEVAAQMAQ